MDNFDTNHEQMTTTEHINQIFFDLFEQQTFIENELD